MNVVIEILHLDLCPFQKHQCLLMILATTSPKTHSFKKIKYQIIEKRKELLNFKIFELTPMCINLYVLLFMIVE